jgi:hypothetical protein
MAWDMSAKRFSRFESLDIPYEVWPLSKDCHSCTSDGIGIQSKPYFDWPVTLLSVQQRKLSVEDTIVGAKMTQETGVD